MRDGCPIVSDPGDKRTSILTRKKREEEREKVHQGGL